MCPRIETPRLILREHTADDLPDFAEMWADPGVVRHISGKPSTLQESWFRLLRYRGLWSVLGYGHWCVCDKQSGRYVGDVGFADYRRDTEPSISGVPEAGWVLSSWAHGRGWGGEAVAAALAWLDREARHRRVVCLINDENTASARIASKNGFVASGAVTLAGEEVPLWSRERRSLE
jgi:RimJ/RimL family protein N-acetyltransferase